MKIEEYINKYTHQKDKISFRYVWLEFMELCEAIFVKRSKDKIKEEFGDTLHFFQMYLYSKFGINQQVWRITIPSVEKFKKRKPVWQRLYNFVGLSKNISGFVGNYKKKEKVINHLKRLGIPEKTASNAFDKIIKSTTSS